MNALTRLIYAAMALVITLCWGTLGYMQIEKFTLLEALYMSVITITTIGFNEVHPLSAGGRAFTMVLAFGGTGLLLLYVGLLTQFVIEGQVSRIFGRRKVEHDVARLKNHYILCGAGRIGGLIAQEFRKKKVSFVIIESDTEQFEQLLDEGYLVMHGSATSRKMLHMARIEQAKGLLMTLGNDADTVFAILTAREINPDLFIIARASEVGSERQITLAGANRVVSPFQAVSVRMTNAVLRPEVMDVLDLTLMDDQLDLAMEGITMGKNCCLVGKTLMESKFRSEFGAMIVAMKKADGKFLIGPGPNEVLEAGDVLIVAGRTEQIEKIADELGS
jgi:voltage-gated potassium channel